MKTISMFKMSILKMLKKISTKHILVALILLFFTGIFAAENMVQNTSISIKKELEELSLDTQQIIDSPIEIDCIIEQNHDVVKKQLIAEVNKYISAKTKNKAHYDLAEYIVENALKHNIDICFMMSQTEIETCFGISGVGRQTSKRSLFGVIKKKYKNYDEAIDDYCKLLKKSYLTKGKTEKDLMRNYVNSGGYRYASNKSYEKELSSVYKKICKNTSINNLQEEYNKAYKEYLTNVENNNDTITSLS